MFNLERFMRLPDYLPWLAYDDDQKLFLLDGNYLGFAFIAPPLAGFDAQIEQRVSSLLTSDFPAGSYLQFNLMVFDDVSDHLEAFQALRSAGETQLIRRTVQNTAEHISVSAKGGAGGMGFPVRNSNLIISLKIPTEGAVPSDDEMAGAARMRREIGEALQTIGFRQLRILNDVELQYHLSMALNRGEHASWRAGRSKPDPSAFLRQQVLDYDNIVKVRRKNMLIGNVVVTPMSVKKLPLTSYFGLAERLSSDPVSGSRGIPCCHMITATIKLQDIIDEKAKNGRREQIMGHYARGPFGSIVPEYRRRHNDLRLVDEKLKIGEFLHRFSLSVTLFSGSEDDAERDVVRTRTYLAELGLTFLEDSGVAFQMLRANLPLGAEKEDQGNFGRYRLMTTSGIGTFLPIFFDWKGSEQPLVSLVSRGGQVMGFDPFDSETNYNFTVSATSGAGKSFLSNELIAGILGTGGKVWVIDVGRSYMKLCESLKGQFLVFDSNSDICLNPFSSIKTVDEFREVQDILLQLLSTMAAPQQGLDDFQTSALQKILQETWEAKNSDLIIDDIILACEQWASDLAEGSDQEFKEKRISDIAMGLQAFGSRGAYGRYFNGPSNIDFTSSFVLLELEELKSQKHLQRIVLLLLIYQIQQGMYLGSRDLRKMLLIDEAWDLLSDPQIAGFIEAGFRRFRKYNGSAGVITQALTDLHDTQTGRAILANSAATVMLNQKPATLNSLASGDNAEFPTALCERLKTVHTKKGKYSEVFISSSAGAGIGRFAVDPYRALLYSTRPNDVADVDRYVSQGFAIDQAIDAVLEERASGGMF